MGKKQKTPNYGTEIIIAVANCEPAIRLAFIWPTVPPCRNKPATIAEWARRSGLGVPLVESMWPRLIDTGACRLDRTLHPLIANYLAAHGAKFVARAVKTKDRNPTSGSSAPRGGH